jgi:hypothetical protein
MEFFSHSIKISTPGGTRIETVKAGENRKKLTRLFYLLL